MLYVLDSSALINNPQFSFEKGMRYACTLEVLEELKSLEVKALAENALKQKLLRVYKPKHKYLKRAQTIAIRNGFRRISKADLSVLALAFQLKEQRRRFVVITDDYSIQNFLEMYKIKFWPAIQGRISETIYFESYCPACMKKFSVLPARKECPNCGVKLKTIRKTYKAAAH